MNYVTKRIKVKAIQFSGFNRDEITAFCNDSDVIWRRPRVNMHHELVIKTDENDIRIDERDWILKFEDGTLAGCDNDIFKQYYQPENKELEQIFTRDELMLKIEYLDMIKKLEGEENEHASN